VSGSYNAYPDVAINVWSGCYSGSWQDDVSTLVAQNASVIVSGPYYITQQNGAPSTPHFTWDQVSSTISGSPVAELDVRNAFALTLPYRCSSS
jgi:hypothetical protein